MPPRGRHPRLARARRGHVTAQRRELPASREAGEREGRRRGHDPCRERGAAPRAGQAPRRWPGPPRALTSPAKSSESHRPTPPTPRRRGEGGRRGEGKGRRGARAPARGTGAPPLPTSSTTRSSDTPTTAAAARGESPGKETTPPLGLRHLRRPGALQGHHGGPGATRSSAPRPGGEQRGVGPALPAEEGRAARHGPRAFGKGRRECPPRPRTPVPPAPRGKKAGGRGRAGVRTTPNPGARPPRTRHDGRARRSRGGRGPRAEREERSHPPWTPVPRLTRLRPGPGEHEITTSIDRQQAAAPRGLPEEQKPSEDGDRGDLLPPHRQAPRPPGGGGAGATGQPQTQRGTPDTRHGALRDRGCHGQRPGAHGMERTGVKDPPPPAHTALPRVPETGGRHRDPGHLESSTRAGAQAQADGSGSSERGQGPARPRGQARNPTRAQRPTSLRRATDGPAVFYVCLSSVCLSPKHNVSAPTWQQKMFISGKKITAPAGGDQPQVTATSRDRDTANCPQNLPHGAPPPPPHGAPRAIWSTQGTGGGGGEEGRYAVGGDATPPRRHAAKPVISERRL